MPTVIKFCGYQGEHSVHTRAARVFCDAIGQYSDGSIAIEFEPNIVAHGHKAADLLAQTEQGDIDGCYFSSSYLSGRVPSLRVFDQHFVVPDRRHAYAILDGAVGEKLAADVRSRTGMVVLGYWDNGLRHLSSARGPIRSPADCRGLKVRCLNSEDHRRVFRALGFDALSIDVRDLPDAVTQFVVDAQENPLTNMYNFGLHKVQRYITLSRHLLGVAPLYFNQATVASWPEAVRATVTMAIQDATLAQRKYAAEEDLKCRALMEQEGCVFTTLTDQERKNFISATEQAVMETQSGFDKTLLRLFDQDMASVKT